MNNIQKRFLLFLIGCIGIRSLFVYIAKNINKNYLPYIGLFALLIGFGFIFVYITGSRTTGAEVFDQKIWWNNLRPFHGMLYIVFALYAFKKENFAYIPLLIDVILGLVAFLNYHYVEGNFNKLL